MKYFRSNLVASVETKDGLKVATDAETYEMMEDLAAYFEEARTEYIIFQKRKKDGIEPATIQLLSCRAATKPKISLHESKVFYKYINEQN